MNLIELFDTLQSCLKENPASAVWLEFRPDLPESSLLSEEELFEHIGSTKVFFTTDFQPFDTEGIFIGSTSRLWNYAHESNTFEEFIKFIEG